MDILSRRNMIYAGENSLPHLILLSFVACAKSLKIIQMNWRNAWKMLPELQSKRSAKLVAPSSGIAKSWKGRGRRRHNNHTEPLTDVVPSSFGCRWWMPRWWGWGVAFDQHENSIKRNYNLKARKWFAARRQKNAPGHKSAPQRSAVELKLSCQKVEISNDPFGHLAG